MPLPKIATPTYELVIPSTKKKIKYRPFLVKEEKVLIIAMESEDPSQIAVAVKDVIKACILSRGVKVEELSTFDIEYLFLNIRGKSVGEEVEVLVTCPDDGETKVPVIIALDDIEVQFDKSHSRDIRLDDTLVMRMKYPSMEEFVKKNFSVSDVNLDETYNVILSSIEQIYNEEESWTTKDCTKKELREFVEGLSSNSSKTLKTSLRRCPNSPITSLLRTPILV